MTISYNRLWHTCLERGVSPADLRKQTGLSSATFTKLRRNETVNLSVLVRIAEVLHCGISDMVSVKEGGEHEH